MRTLIELFRDESGTIISTQAALIGTLGIVGAGYAYSTYDESVQDELSESSYAIRSLDQSYSYEGRQSGSAWSAGSSYIQPPVEESIAQLKKEYESNKAKAREQNKATNTEKLPATILPHDSTKSDSDSEGPLKESEEGPETLSI